MSGKTAGTFDVYLFSPEHKEFGSTVELRAYLKKTLETTYTESKRLWLFSI